MKIFLAEFQFKCSKEVSLTAAVTIWQLMNADKPIKSIATLVLVENIFPIDTLLVIAGFQ
jgi:hypothetical protein